jgi:hypothetical protein
MFGEYGAALKWLIIAAIIAAVVGVIVAIDQNGYNRRDKEVQLNEALKIASADEKLKQLNRLIEEKNTVLIRLTQHIDRMGDDYEQEIDKLNNDLVVAHNNSVQRKGLCASHHTAKPVTTSSSGSVIEKAADTAQISEEFEKFLISSAWRADEAGIYAELASEWINELCKNKDFFVCN